MHLSVRHVRVLCQNESTYSQTPSGRPAILAYSYQTLWQYSDEDPEVGQKSRFSINVLLWDECRMSSCQQISTVEYVDSSKRRLRLYQSTVTPKRTEQNLFVRICKSEAEVSNNKLIMRSSIEVLYCWSHTQSRDVCDSWASCRHLSA